MAGLYIPDGVSESEAKKRVTHMGIGAHQDDLEIFAYHGIQECFEREDRWFAGITVTDGGGSSRSGPFASYSDEEMKAVRFEEQNRAAKIGKYAFQAQLGFSSNQVKDTVSSGKVSDQILALLKASKPEVLYLHNPADKHDTHVAVLTCCIEALRRMGKEELPKLVYGCEVWRDLDWLQDSSKVMLPVDRHPHLAEELIAVFESQVAGGKDYVKATLGRRLANATYFDSHRSDQAKAYTVAMDLIPLISNPSISMADYVDGHLTAFREDVLKRIQNYDA